MICRQVVRAASLARLPARAQRRHVGGAAVERQVAWLLGAAEPVLAECPQQHVGVTEHACTHP